jgi:hypothetical protein
MRKALFAVVLVAASFMGGAAVNGPGLRLAQTWAMGRLGLVQEGGDGGPVVGLRGDNPSDDAHASPIPPLDVNPAPAAGANDQARAKGPAKDPDTNRSDRPPPAPTPTPAPAAGVPIAPEPSVTGSGSPAPAPTPAPTTPDPLEPLSSAEPARPAPLPPLHDSEPQAGDATRDKNKEKKNDPPDPPAPAAPRDARPGGDASVSLASLARTGRDEPAGDAKATAEIPADPTDWTEVRHALRTLGVSRYGIDGEPGGRVRFHCVIPLAGRRAVGQHFEAEADDELQAARAALRRIALWRASEGGNP